MSLTGVSAFEVFGSRVCTRQSRRRIVTMVTLMIRKIPISASLPDVTLRFSYSIIDFLNVTANNRAVCGLWGVRNAASQPVDFAHDANFLSK